MKAGLPLSYLACQKGDMLLLNSKKKGPSDADHTLLLNSKKKGPDHTIQEEGPPSADHSNQEGPPSADHSSIPLLLNSKKKGSSDDADASATPEELHSSKTSPLHADSAEKYDAVQVIDNRSGHIIYFVLRTEKNRQNLLLLNKMSRYAEEEYGDEEDCDYSYKPRVFVLPDLGVCKEAVQGMAHGSFFDLSFRTAETVDLTRLRLTETNYRQFSSYEVFCKIGRCVHSLFTCA